MDTKKLIAEAALLPVEERARVVDSLLQSLDPSESGIDDSWSREALKRLDELRSGRVDAVPGQKVFDRIWKRLDR